MLVICLGFFRLALRLLCGRHPNSRRLPLASTESWPLYGVYCPAFNGRSIAGPPAPAGKGH